MTETAEAVPPISPEALRRPGRAGCLRRAAHRGAAGRGQGRTGSPAGQRPVRRGAGARDDRRGRRGAGRRGGGYRGEAWRAAGATGEGTAILLHYTAMRLASEVRAISEQLPADLGVMSAAAGAAGALKLLLEVCTVRSMDDPRAAAVTANLARACGQLATAAAGIGALFAAARDVATIISPPV